jgi:hypothetical protein
MLILSIVFSKLCMLACYHMEIHIFSGQFDWIIFEGVVPCFLLNISSKGLYQKLLTCLICMHSSKLYMLAYHMQIHISLWQFHQLISDGVIALFSRHNCLTRTKGSDEVLPSIGVCSLYTFQKSYEITVPIWTTLGMNDP